MKQLSAFAGRFLPIVLVLVLFGCATGPPPKPLPEKAVLAFSEDYDRVWAAVLDTLDHEGFVIDQMAKEDGYITTDIKQMGADLRGKLSVRLASRDGLVEVTVNSYTEELESRVDRKEDGFYYWNESGRYRSHEERVLKEINSRLKGP